MLNFTIDSVASIVTVERKCLHLLYTSSKIHTVFSDVQYKPGFHKKYRLPVHANLTWDVKLQTVNFMTLTQGYF